MAHVTEGAGESTICRSDQQAEKSGTVVDTADLT